MFWTSPGYCKVLFNLEPPGLYPVKDQIHRFIERADFVLTSSSPADFSHPDKVFPFLYGSTWIQSGYMMVHLKSKMISIIASGKTTLVGHKLRHELVQKHRDAFDIYGHSRSYFERLLCTVDNPKTSLRYIQYLMSLDLADFHPQRDRPITDAYRGMMASSKPLVAEFVSWLLDQNLLTGEEEEVANTRVYEWYIDWRRVEDPSRAVVASRKLMLDLNNHQLTTSGRASGNKACKIFRADLKDVLIQQGWYDAQE